MSILNQLQYWYILPNNNFFDRIDMLNPGL